MRGAREARRLLRALGQRMGRRYGNLLPAGKPDRISRVQRQVKGAFIAKGSPLRIGSLLAQPMYGEYLVQPTGEATAATFSPAGSVDTITNVKTFVP